MLASGACWLLAVSPIPAQTSPALPLSLAEARTQARRTSPDLAAARHALRAAQARQRQAGAFPNPQLVYGREQTSRDGFESSQDVVALDQRLAFFGPRGAQRNAASAQAAAAAARVDVALARLEEEVTRSYAALGAADRRAELAAQAARAFTHAVEVSASRLAGGDVSGYQHRRLRLEAARYTALRLEALATRDSTRRVLTTLLGLDADSLVLVDTLPAAPLPLPADSLVALALVQRAELRVARLEADAAAAERRVASAERLPVPLLSAGYKTEQPGTGGRLNGFILGASLSLPLWDQRGGAIAATKAELDRRESEVEALRRQTTREVYTASTALEALTVELAAVGAELGPEAARARRAAEAAYAEGEIGLLEWLDSVRAYYEAESSYVTLWSAYVARRAALERATGAKLF